MERIISVAVDVALGEDLGPEGRDLTTEAVIRVRDGAAVIIANDQGILAGTAVAVAVFRRLDPLISSSLFLQDGDLLRPGQTVASIKGDLRAILAGERSALNLLGHLSGIATLTNRYVRAAQGTGVKIYDTRKTHVGLRALEKLAVKVGGGHNHRFGLFDGILIKDNHLAVSTVGQAVRSAKTSYPGSVVEIEVETLSQLEEALEAGADIVLLDNMDLDNLRTAIGVAKVKAEIEVSGGVELGNIRAIAELGPDRVSTGKITQSAQAIDFSLSVQSDAYEGS